MRTGIIGTGRIGSVLARILVAAGHEVVLANARGHGDDGQPVPDDVQQMGGVADLPELV
ncbi:NAD(P)-binding domain-containing protein, partial [Streptomyces sp. NPDC004050]